jgi:hypothetical protein
VNGTLPAGRYREEWNGLTDSGIAATSGIYFYRLKTATGVMSRKMIMMR